MQCTDGQADGATLMSMEGALWQLRLAGKDNYNFTCCKAGQADEVVYQAKGEKLFAFFVPCWYGR